MEEFRVLAESASLTPSTVSLVPPHPRSTESTAHKKSTTTQNPDIVGSLAGVTGASGL